MKEFSFPAHHRQSDPSTDFDLAAYLAAYKTDIDDHLRRWLDTMPADQLILPAMQYSLLGGGKRMRPILCLASAEAVGGDKSLAMPTACALEFIHCYSLIHDDLPAMDDDELRRGRPTCHRAFNEATAILAGDALLTQAFDILSTAEIEGSKIPAHIRLSVLNCISRAAGPLGMVEGQMQDLNGEDAALTLPELKKLHALKTGELICASLLAGAYIGNGNEKQIRELERYGRAIGLAYQVADDILNVEGDPDILGKSVGSDARRGKSTYPALLGLSESKTFARSLVENALHALNDFDNKADPLRAIAHYVISRQY